MSLQVSCHENHLVRCTSLYIKKKKKKATYIIYSYGLWLSCRDPSCSRYDELEAHSDELDDVCDALDLPTLGEKNSSPSISIIFFVSPPLQSPVAHSAHFLREGFRWEFPRVISFRATCAAILVDGTTSMVVSMKYCVDDSVVNSSVGFRVLAGTFSTSASKPDELFTIRDGSVELLDPSTSSSMSVTFSDLILLRASCFRRLHFFLRLRRFKMKRSTVLSRLSVLDAGKDKTDDPETLLEDLRRSRRTSGWRMDLRDDVSSSDRRPDAAVDVCKPQWIAQTHQETTSDRNRIFVNDVIESYAFTIARLALREQWPSFFFSSFAIDRSRDGNPFAADFVEPRAGSPRFFSSKIDVGARGARKGERKLDEGG